MTRKVAGTRGNRQRDSEWGSRWGLLPAGDPLGLPLRRVVAFFESAVGPDFEVGAAVHVAGVGDAAIAVADGDEVLEGVAEAVDDDEAAVFEGVDHFAFFLFLDLFLGGGDASIEEDLTGVVRAAGDAGGFLAFGTCEGVIAVACEDLVEGDGTAYRPLFAAEAAGAERVCGDGVVAVFALVLFDDGGDGGDAVERLLFLAFADGEFEASEAHGPEEGHDGDDRHDLDEGEACAAAGGSGRFHVLRVGDGAEGRRGMPAVDQPWNLVMTVMSGWKRASTMTATMTARTTIMIGSSREVRAETELSTSSS